MRAVSDRRGTPVGTRALWKHGLSLEESLSPTTLHLGLGIDVQGCIRTRISFLFFSGFEVSGLRVEG